MENAIRQQRMASEIQKICGTYIKDVASPQSLVTITNVEISKDLRHGILFISVLPEDQEDPAIKFLERNLADMRDHLKKHFRSNRIPFLSIKKDLGEKNRQRIDELSQH